ncbi:hypothetical protein OHS33_36975 [Streptomyces sp. NBC_00536]|uniref:hypothetical protein n=1 Tax=Streptomyces sp. NBC_00536 TaxID=2975769 RepID=UPI002E820020|nr:hypothetical protein [Streptomyces sp. NBC_00536]WUC83464.1 hypothetical protein OHS33_36975 [Streptomyces sp. NBC_00536]
MKPVPQLLSNGLPVPFIAPWSGERSLPGEIVHRRGPGRGIGYADEQIAGDRWNDVLWIRYSFTPGRGRPELGGTHPMRQRQAISHMLCQVCGTSTISTSGGDERHLFLVAAPDGEPITEGERTTSPPIHAACAVKSLRHCPHLKRGHTAALVEYCPLWGVAGITHDPRTLLPLPSGGDGEGLDFVSYTDPLLPWTLAARLVITLHGCTTVDLADLAAQTAVA